MVLIDRKEMLIPEGGETVSNVDPRLYPSNTECINCRYVWGSHAGMACPTGDGSTFATGPSQSSLLREARERLQQLLDAKKSQMVWDEISLNDLPQIYVEIEDFLKRSKEATGG